MSRCFCVSLAFAILLAGGVARAQPYPSASDGTELWLAAPDAQGPAVVLLHRRMSDAATLLRHAGRFTGKVAEGGAACGSGRLWLVYSDLNVMSMEFQPEHTGAPAGFTQPRVERRLPAGVELRSLAASRSGPWALVRKAVEPPADADATEAPTHVDQLLGLKQSEWSAVDLPADWSMGARAWLVMLRDGDAMPSLVTLPATDRLIVYSRAADQWQRSEFKVNLPVSADLLPLAVDSQLLIGHVTVDGQVVTATMYLLREGASQRMGELTIPEAPTTNWTLASAGQMAALIVLDAPVSGATPGQSRTPGAVWRTMDLQGRTTPAAMVLAVETYSPFEREPGQLLMLVVVSLSMLLMFAIRRPDARQTLPKTVVIADLPRRMLAAVIDLAPCVVIVMIVFDMQAADLMQWTQIATRWQDLLPRLAIIGLNVAHTLLSELFTARTLGKLVCGLRVSRMDGSPPDVWQVLARNLLRAFDLVAWCVLPILMFLSSNRQRLGDMVANTVVIADAPEEDPHAGDLDE